MSIRKIFKNLVLVAFFVVAGGCTYLGPGIYHTVGKGETLWNIADAYNVNVNDIVRANRRRFKDPDRIRPGQEVYVPGAKYEKRVPKSRFNFSWPVRGKLAHKFGRKGNMRFLGIGIAAPPGTPVRAAEEGKVIFVSDNFRSYGKTIIIEHSKDYVTVYARNRNNLVSVDKVVAKGEKIAEVGSTGWSDKPYLYFEIRYREKPRNPLFMLP